MDREGRKTIAEELDERGRRDYRFTEADLDPTVIQIQVLERGQYFVRVWLKLSSLSYFSYCPSSIQ